MRNFTSIILFLLCLHVEAQTSPNFTIITTPASCSSCCDGTAGIASLNPNCLNFAVAWFDANGFVSATSLLNNCCAGTSYSASVSSQCGSNDVFICSISYQFSTNIFNSFIADFSISPNPTNSIINIVSEQMDHLNSTIEIKDYLGQDVFISPFTSQIDLHNFSAGMYFLTIQDKEKKLTIKIIKQ